jgi:transposase
MARDHGVMGGTRDALRAQGIEPVIARRGEDHGSGLGRIRWVVERTVSRFKGFRLIRVRYDRLIPIQHAWNEIAAAIICFRIALRRGISLG